MNPYLDEDLVTLGDHARRFATDRVAPGFQERDQTRVLDRQLMREMGEMGFIAPELPEAVRRPGPGVPGGRRDPRGDRPRRPEHQLHQPAGLAELADPVAARPARGRRSRGCDKLMAGEALCAIALTEPRGGSDAANLRLQVERSRRRTT